MSGFKDDLIELNYGEDCLKVCHQTYPPELEFKSENISVN